MGPPSGLIINKRPPTGRSLSCILTVASKCVWKFFIKMGSPRTSKFVELKVLSDLLGTSTNVSNQLLRNENRTKSDRASSVSESSLHQTVLRRDKVGSVKGVWRGNFTSKRITVTVFFNKPEGVPK